MEEEEEEEEKEKEKEKKVEKEKEKVETSQPGSASSNRSAGKKSTGYEYVIPPAALAITSLNNSIKSFEGIIVVQRQTTHNFPKSKQT